MNIQLDDWQKEALEHNGNLLLCTGRQVGKTYIMSRKAITRMLKQKTNIIVVSLTEEQAMLIINMCKDIIQELAPAQLVKKHTETNKKTITLKNRSKLISRPVGDNGDSIRGYTADILIVDEASRMGKFFWASALPVILTTKGQIWICSTPRGKQGFFWERFNEAYNLQDPSASFKVIYTNSLKVINERPITTRWTEEHKKQALQLIEDQRKMLTPIEFQQEYMGLFLDEIRQYFSDELIEKACILERQTPIGTIFMGVDIARFGHDKISYEFIDKVSDTEMYHRENITKSKQDTWVTEQDIIALSQTWKAAKIGIDSGSGSLGVGIYDRLMHDERTKAKVVAMTNQKISLNRDGTDRQRIFKEDMYENLHYLMETGKLKLLRDPSLKQCLKNVQIEVEDGKTKIFAHPSADEVEGVVRAAYLAEKAKVNKLFIAYM